MDGSFALGRTKRNAKGQAWLCLLALAAAMFAAFAGIARADDFPPLTGRIADQANVIPQQSRDKILPKLKDLEEKSGIQLVVATVSSLGGQEIEPYANGLFRAWKLGEKDKNNGVLLLIAPKEHRARIEVGYGLEGTLTDALSKVIITNAMVPRFKTGDYGGAVERGVDDIITVLTTDSSEWQKRPDLRAGKQNTADELGPLILIIFIVIFILILRSSHRGMTFGGGGSSGVYWGSSSGGSSDSGGGGSSDSFSGGGGSSGGGGASGDW